MFEDWLTALNDLVLQLGSFINSIISSPSKIIPLITPDMVLVAISVLFGYFFSTKAELGFKTLSGIVLSILFFCFIKFIGGA